MEDLSLHILDIVENSVAANADKVEIIIEEDINRDLLSVKIRDNGTGMDKKTITKVIDPFFTTKKTRRIGLGIPLLLEATKAANGDFSISSKKGKGTTIKAQFQYSHIDRKPLGDINQTLITLVIGNPEIDFIYSHKKNGSQYLFDTRRIKSQLKGIPINSPDGIRIIRENLEKIQMKLRGVKNER